MIQDELSYLWMKNIFWTNLNWNNNKVTCTEVKCPKLKWFWICKMPKHRFAPSMTAIEIRPWPCGKLDPRLRNVHTAAWSHIRNNYTSKVSLLLTIHLSNICNFLSVFQPENETYIAVNCGKKRFFFLD